MQSHKSNHRKVLLISFFNPLEPNSGSGIRSNCLLKNLTELGYTIHLFALSQSDNSCQTEDYPNIAKSYCIPKVAQPKLITLIRSLIHLQPIAVPHFFSKTVHDKFVQFIAGETYHTIIFDYLYTFDLRKHLQNAGRMVIYEHNTEYLMCRDHLKHSRGLLMKPVQLLDYLLLKRYEFKALASANCVVHVWENDLNNFNKDIRAKSIIIPNTLPYKIGHRTKTTSQNNVVFVGSMTHYANTEGILRFIQEVWPEVNALRADVNLLIVGGNPPSEIMKYNGRQNIHVLGFVEDLSEIYRKATLSITPTNIGSGARLKILEAMMHSTLNVVSPKGAEGLDVQDGVHIIIAGDRQGWINKILFYLDNKEKRVLLEKNAHDLVEKYYCYDNYKQAILRCVGD